MRRAPAAGQCWLLLGSPAELMALDYGRVKAGLTLTPTIPPPVHRRPGAATPPARLSVVRARTREVLRARGSIRPFFVDPTG